MKKKLTIGSLFAGIGGICIAFKQAGYKISWANEIDINACKTYRYNFPRTKLYEGDIHNLNPNEVEKVDVVTSGFPCQAFSIAGYRQGFRDTKGRGNLFFETARVINEIRPSAYLLENVRNLVGHDKGNTFRTIKNVLVEELGYSFIPFIMNSKDYGDIPQTRERVYIVGFRDESEYLNDEVNKVKNSGIMTLEFTIPKPITLEKSIRDMLLSGKQDGSFYYDESHIYHTELAREMKKRDTVYQWRRVYVRENKSNLCPTLTANMGTGGHNVPLVIDNYGIRKLVPKECLNFQGFPSDFNFPKNMANSHCYKQAGNSVVVPVVKRIADEISRVLKH